MLLFFKTYCTAGRYNIKNKRKTKREKRKRKRKRKKKKEKRKTKNEKTKSVVDYVLCAVSVTIFCVTGVSFTQFCCS